MIGVLKPENALTVDVEDYYQVEAFSGTVDRANWGGFESRVERNTGNILDLFDQYEVKATFFVLGCVAKKSPSIVREIAARGHEIASHGMSHKLIYTQAPDVFQQETRESKQLLEDQCQQPVIGYRAATYSITGKSLWALDILHEEGFKYDSSIFPMQHDLYGIPDAEGLPHELKTPNGNSLVEFPISLASFGRVKIPVAGGGYFRLFPYAITRWGLERINKESRPFVFYLHPWEIDPAQPRIEGAPLKSRFRHYLNLSRCEARLKLLLGDFRFTTMRNTLVQTGLVDSQ